MTVGSEQQEDTGTEGTQDTGNENGNESQGTSDALTDFFPDLSEMPAEQREFIDPILADIQKNINGRFEDHASYRKEREPYDEIGITDYEPEAITAGLDLLNMIASADEDPEAKEAFENFIREAAGELGMNFAEEGEVDPDDENFDPLEDEGISQEDIQQMVVDAVTQAVSPMYQQMQQKEQQQQYSQTVEQVNEQVDNRIQELAKENGITDPDALKAFDSDIARMALPYAETHEPVDAINEAHNDYKRIKSSGGQELFENVENQPKPGEGGGTPDTNAEPITTMEQAREAVKSRLASGQV